MCCSGVFSSDSKLLNPNFFTCLQDTVGMIQCSRYVGCFFIRTMRQRSVPQRAHLNPRKARPHTLALRQTSRIMVSLMPQRSSNQTQASVRIVVFRVSVKLLAVFVSCNKRSLRVSRYTPHQAERDRMKLRTIMGKLGHDLFLFYA